jgi:biopolymer transport protein ExbB
MQPTAPASVPAAAGSVSASSGAESGLSLQALFWQSFDLFTVLLVIGSIIAGAVIVRCVLEIRRGVILPEESERTIRRLIRDGKSAELHAFVERDGAFVSRVVKAAIEAPAGNRESMREAAELAAGEQVSGWFRKVEPLNVIGNLGPLLGLAGTVWGMIIAFAALGSSGGQANPAALSTGISKALFHTLLGLMLAVPALLAFGHFRSVVDRLCTRALSLATELVEMLPERAAGVSRDGSAFTPAGGGNARRETSEAAR